METSRKANKTFVLVLVFCVLAVSTLMLTVSAETATTTPPKAKPNFLIAADHTSLTMKAGTSKSLLIGVDALNGFKGTISLTNKASPAIKAKLSAGSLTVAAKIAPLKTCHLGVLVPSTTLPGTYKIMVTATSSSLQHSVIITVTVVA
jgi:hypothetical protein